MVRRMADERTGRHAGGGAQVPGPDEPTFAERARTLVHAAKLGTLSTHSRRADGFPFGSLAPYGTDAAGRPTFLFSTMAMHTQNLLADPRASLLVAQPGSPAARALDGDEDPLAGARVTLVGSVAEIDAADRPAIRDDYLSRHENARHWVEFEDFAFYRLDPTELYYVGGFGSMGWVAADDYRAASPDPLADSAPGIIAHMNRDHADALVLYARVFGSVDAEEATMLSVDRLGFRVRTRKNDEYRGVRINFTREARTPEEARKVLVEMVRDARAKVGGA
jgi:heme oxygenase (biliverdin-IX-beta and delta-forming)